MILTCPSCDTRYSVDGSKFPAAGRTVRCAKCGHSWHQAGETLEPEIAPDIAELSPESDPEPRAAPADAAAASDPYPVNPSSTRAYAPLPSVPTLRAPLVMNPQGLEEHKTGGLKRLALTTVSLVVAWWLGI